MHWDTPRHPDDSCCIYNDNFFNLWPSKKSEKASEKEKATNQESSEEA